MPLSPNKTRPTPRLRMRSPPPDTPHGDTLPPPVTPPTTLAGTCCPRRRPTDRLDLVAPPPHSFLTEFAPRLLLERQTSHGWIGLWLRDSRNRPAAGVSLGRVSVLEPIRAVYAILPAVIRSTDIANRATNDDTIGRQSARLWALGEPLTTHRSRHGSVGGDTHNPSLPPQPARATALSQSPTRTSHPLPHTTRGHS